MLHFKAMCSDAWIPGKLSYKYRQVLLIILHIILGICLYGSSCANRSEFASRRLCLLRCEDIWCNDAEYFNDCLFVHTCQVVISVLTPEQEQKEQIRKCVCPKSHTGMGRGLLYITLMFAEPSDERDTNQNCDHCCCGTVHYGLVGHRE